MNLMKIIRRAWGKLLSKLYHGRYKHITSTSFVHYNVEVYNPDNLVMEENTNIDSSAVIMNGRAKLIMKKNSGAAIQLLVVTGNHLSVVGKNFKEVTNAVKDKVDVNHTMDRDVVVEEECWIGARCTLLSGASVGRGSVIGSNSVVRGIVPPYTVMVGNPAKVVGFRFTPEEVIEHEKVIYEELERLPLELLERNYEKYFINRAKDISAFLKI